MKLTQGQLQYVNRELFSTGIDPFQEGVCSSTDHLFVALSCIRSATQEQFLNLNQPIFWFKEQRDSFGGSPYGSQTRAYFIDRTTLRKIEIPLYFDEAPRIESLRKTEMPDEDAITEISNRHQIVRDRAFLNSRLITRYPEITTTLQEYLAGYPYQDLWREKFPGMIETNMPEPIYGESTHMRAGDMMVQFLDMIGGKRPERKTLEVIRRQLNRILK